MTPKIKFFAVNGLSTFDAAATMFLVGFGYSQESNPILAWLIGYSLIAFFLFKTLLVLGFSSLCLKLYNRKKNARRMLNVALTAFTLVVGWQLLLLWSLTW